MEFLIELFQTSIIDIIKIMWKMAYIIFLVMLLLEILKSLKLLDKINVFTAKFTKYIGISASANFALVIGVLIGISYGAGAIIASYSKNEMSKKDVVLVSTFLCICHAVIEDTIIFAGQGANVFIISVPRIMLAVLVTYLVNKYMVYKESKKLAYEGS